MNSSAENLEAYRLSFRKLFSCSSAHIALVDFNGVILETNPEWNRFALDNGMPASYQFKGRNYLDICESGAAANQSYGRDAYLGLLEVIHTRRPKFTMIYPCHGPSQRRWFRMWVEPQTPDVPAIIVAHYLCATKPVVEPTHPAELWPGSPERQAPGKHFHS